MSGRRVSILFAVVAAGAAAIVLSVTTGSAQPAGARTIKLFEPSKGSTFAFVDNPPKANRRHPRESIGDLFVLSNPVLDKSQTHRLGRSAAQCTTSAAGSPQTAIATCFGTLTLNDGTLAIQTTVRGEPRKTTMAVTGGTGAYAGARGTLVAVAGRSGSTDTVTLLP
jgi:hypothetical protein